MLPLTWKTNSTALTNTFQQPGPPTIETHSKDYSLLQSIEAMVSAISARGEILACNGTRVKQTCFSIAELANRKLANAIALPGETDALQVRQRQRVAPFDSRELLPKDCFIEVDCSNIGARGIRFFLDTPPVIQNPVAK